MRKDSEIVVVLKWAGMLFGITGTMAAAFDVWPLAPVLLVINCAIWAAVGRAWREPTVWLTNVFAGSVSLLLLVVKLVNRSL